MRNQKLISSIGSQVWIDGLMDWITDFHKWVKIVDPTKVSQKLCFKTLIVGVVNY